MAVTTIGGNVFAAGVATVALTPASVAAATSAEQTFTVPGVLPGDYVDATGVTQNGIGIGQARVTAANTVGIRFINATAGALIPTAGLYTFLIVRPEVGQMASFSP